MTKQELLTDMVADPSKYLRMVQTTKKYLVAADLGISPTELSHLLPIIEEVHKQYKQQ